MQQLDLASLYTLVEQRYLTCRPHPDPEVDLLIWNYTPKTMYDQYWTPQTYICRGLVTTTSGEIVARPFVKFHNLDEYIEHNWPIPYDEPVTVTEKIDGSLISVFLYQGKVQVASRGSFRSEQALKAREILERKYTDFPFSVHYTYLFEVVYKENRIVVDYGDMEDLVLLATIYTQTGDEHSIYEPLWHTKWPFPTVPYLYMGSLEQWEQPEELENREGYVVRFSSGLRVKIKLEAYKRIHAIITHTSSTTIWEYLKEGKSLVELLDRVPVDFQAWVKHLSKDLSQQYTHLYTQSKAVYKQVVDAAWIPNSVDGRLALRSDDLEQLNRAMKREIADEFRKYPDLEHFLHLLYSGTGRGKRKREFSDAIWDSIKPQYSRPFFLDGEEKRTGTTPQEEERKELQPA